MALKEVTEEILIHKIGVPLIQGGIIRITVLDKLRQPIVPIKREKPRVFVSVDKSVKKRGNHKEDMSHIYLRALLRCILEFFGADIKANLGARRAADS